MTRRRLHVENLTAGRIQLSPQESHHAANVLRLQVGDDVELFDDAGNEAHARIERLGEGALIALIDSVQRRDLSARLSVASALPKGERADWMIEKLSELGVSRFVPLITARSVVHPAGKSKARRWDRIAIESAKQSRRAGVMRIEPLTKLHDALNDSSALFLSTERSAVPILHALEPAIRNPRREVSFLVGPEGGWTPEELSLFRQHNLTGVKLTATILRVETAAVAAATIAATLLASTSHDQERS